MFTYTSILAGSESPLLSFWCPLLRVCPRQVPHPPHPSSSPVGRCQDNPFCRGRNRGSESFPDYEELRVLVGHSSPGYERNEDGCAWRAHTGGCLLWGGASGRWGAPPEGRRAVWAEGPATRQVAVQVGVAGCGSRGQSGLGLLGLGLAPIHPLASPCPEDLPAPMCPLGTVPGGHGWGITSRCQAAPCRFKRRAGTVPSTPVDPAFWAVLVMAPQVPWVVREEGRALPSLGLQAVCVEHSGFAEILAEHEALKPRWQTEATWPPPRLGQRWAVTLTPLFLLSLQQPPSLRWLARPSPHLPRQPFPCHKPPRIRQSQGELPVGSRRPGPAQVLGGTELGVGPQGVHLAQGLTLCLEKRRHYRRSQVHIVAFWEERVVLRPSPVFRSAQLYRPVPLLRDSQP